MVARNRLVISGSLGPGGIEQWSTGFTFGADNPPQLIITPSALAEWAEDSMTVLRAVSTGATELRSLLSSSGTIDRVTAYYYDVSGPAVNVGASSSAQILGTSSPTHPPQVALVCSLLTGLAGRSRRGRAYWPALNGTISSTLMMSTATALQAAEAFEEVLGAIQLAAFPSGDTGLVVHSSTLDLVTPVTQLSVGTALDTQRRRRDSLVELYQTVDYVPV